MKRAIDWALMLSLFASFPKCMITSAQPLKLTIARAELSSERISESLHNDSQMFPSEDGIQSWGPVPFYQMRAHLLTAL